MDYKELRVWKESRELVKDIYRISAKFPKEELFGLTNQIRRAAVSIPSNIAEGHNRYSDREFIHFLTIAKGSAAEVETQMIIAVDLGYLTDEEAEWILDKIDKTIRTIGSLISSVREKPQRI
jgi:four helix bundle protein